MLIQMSYILRNARCRARQILRTSVMKASLLYGLKESSLWALAKQENDLVVQRRIAAATKASHARISGVNITDMDTVGCKAS